MADRQAVNRALKDRGGHELARVLGTGLPGSLPEQVSQLSNELPQDGEIFFKVGNTTGWTAGQYNGCRSADLTWHPDTPTMQWCFIGLPKSADFSDKGDSGSLVFDRNGSGVGLLYGGRPPTRLGNITLEELKSRGEQVFWDITYVTPLQNVFAHIRKVLQLDTLDFANA